MKIKKTLLYKITLIVQIGWLAVLLTDMIILILFHTSVFTLKLWGGDVSITYGLGYSITTYYPLGTEGSVAPSDDVNAYILIFGQVLLTIANIIQGIRYRKRRKSLLGQHRAER